MQILLSRTKARSSRAVKQEQEEVSPGWDFWSVKIVEVRNSRVGRMFKAHQVVGGFRGWTNGGTRQCLAAILHLVQERTGTWMSHMNWRLLALKILVRPLSCVPLLFLPTNKSSLSFTQPCANHYSHPCIFPWKPGKIRDISGSISNEPPLLQPYSCKMAPRSFLSADCSTAFRIWQRPTSLSFFPSCTAAVAWCNHAECECDHTARQNLALLWENVVIFIQYRNVYRYILPT